MKNLYFYIDKYKKMGVQVKASIWYTGCNILQKGISFIVIPIYTRLLTTSEYGQYTVFQSWRDIILIFATLNLYCGVFTKAMVDYNDDRDAYTSSMQGLGSVITTILFFAYLALSGLWSRLFGMSKVTMILLFIYYYVYPAFSFWSVRQRVEYRYKKMVAVTLLVSVFTPILSVALLYFTSLRENAVIYGYLIVQIMVGAFFYILNFYRGKIFFNKRYWVHALKFNIPLIPHYLSLIVLGQADRIMIDKYCGSAEAGIYGLAYQVSMALNIVISAVNNAMVPWTYEKLKTTEYSLIKKNFRYICLFMMLMTVGVILIAPEIITILSTAEYMDAVWVIPAVAVSVYFTYCYGLFSNVEFYYGATQYVMVASSVGAILNVILNAIFIPLFGFIAAGYTTMVCYLCFMAMHYLFMEKVCQKNNIHESIYDVRFMVGSCLAITLIGGVCLSIYKYIVIRYCSIGLGFMMAIICRKRVMKFWTEVKKEE